MAEMEKRGTGHRGYKSGGLLCAWTALCDGVVSGHEVDGIV